MKPRALALLASLGLALLSFGDRVSAEPLPRRDVHPATAAELGQRDAMSLALFDQDRLMRDELRSLDTLLLVYVQLGGTSPQLFRLVDTCIRHRCRGPCMMEALRQLNGALSDGTPLPVARATVAAVVVRETRKARRAGVAQTELAQRVRDAGRIARLGRHRAPPAPADDQLQRVRGKDPTPPPTRRRRHR